MSGPGCGRIARGATLHLGGMRSRLDGGNRVVEVDRGQRKCLARAGFTIVPGLSHPIEWECDCGCRIPLSVLQPAGDGFDQALAAFLAWLSSNGHALRGGNLDLRPEDAALSGLAGEPLVDLRYRYDGRDVVLRAAELAPFLVYETATLRQLAASSSLPNLVALVTGRLADLRQLGIVPELTGSLAAPLLAASQSQEMPLPRDTSPVPRPDNHEKPKLPVPCCAIRAEKLQLLMPGAPSARTSQHSSGPG